jgi:hypothetical protein
MDDSFDAAGPRWWAVALLAAWAALLLGGFLLGGAGSGEHRMPTWTRMGSSLTLVAAGWCWYGAARGRPAEAFALLIAVGMTLGFVGDLFMAGLIPLGDRVLCGIAAFGCGHVAYIGACWALGHRAGLDAPGSRWGAWLAWLAVGLAGWFLVVLPGDRPATLRWAALPYTLLLASTAGFASGLAVQAPALWGLALGAALFLASDLILAGELFRGWTFPLVGDVVWLTYGPGQMLIVYSARAALAVAGKDAPTPEPSVS